VEGGVQVGEKRFRQDRREEVQAGEEVDCQVEQNRFPGGSGRRCPGRREEVQAGEEGGVQVGEKKFRQERKETAR
jgi:hypothetical protein